MSTPHNLPPQFAGHNLIVESFGQPSNVGLDDIVYEQWACRICVNPSHPRANAFSFDNPALNC
jgi:hypothetical protein